MRKLLIPYLTAGFPEKTWLIPLVEALDKNGADFIEIGIPFSDPIADGPTIQAASQKALANGVNARWVLGEIEKIRPKLRSELVFFSYYNPFNALCPKIEDTARLLKQTGFHGVLIPDLALEEAGPLIAALNREGLHYIPLIAPTTTEKRLRFIAPHTTSFAYGVSVTGVTGARRGVASGLEDYLNRVRRHFKQFVVGFGISTPEDAAEISKIADGVVIGSALIRLLEGVSNQKEAVSRLSDFIKKMRLVLDQSN